MRATKYNCRLARDVSSRRAQSRCYDLVDAAELHVWTRRTVHGWIHIKICNFEFIINLLSLTEGFRLCRHVKGNKAYMPVRTPVMRTCRLTADDTRWQRP